MYRGRNKPWKLKLKKKSEESIIKALRSLFRLKKESNQGQNN